jgi:hypothetical protein
VQFAAKEQANCCYRKQHHTHKHVAEHAQPREQTPAHAPQLSITYRWRREQLVRAVRGVRHARAAFRHYIIMVCWHLCATDSLRRK